VPGHALTQAVGFRLHVALHDHQMIRIEKEHRLGFRVPLDVTQLSRQTRHLVKLREVLHSPEDSLGPITGRSLDTPLQLRDLMFKNCQPSSQLAVGHH
jgi:hypothetical protein